MHGGQKRLSRQPAVSAHSTHPRTQRVGAARVHHARLPLPANKVRTWVLRNRVASTQKPHLEIGNETSGRNPDSPTPIEKSPRVSAQSQAGDTRFGDTQLVDHALILTSHCQRYCRACWNENPNRPGRTQPLSLEARGCDSYRHAHASTSHFMASTGHSTKLMARPSAAGAPAAGHAGPGPRAARRGGRCGPAGSVVRVGPAGRRSSRGTACGHRAV